MRIALVDCANNKLDVYDMLNEICTERVADLNLVRFTSPEVLKVPLSVKRTLGENADVALVFLTLSGEESGSLDLAREKLIDVELETNKFAFVCVVFDDEWRTPQQLAEISAKKLVDSVELILGTLGGGTNAPQDSAPEQESLGIPEEADVSAATSSEQEEKPSRGGGGIHNIF